MRVDEFEIEKKWWNKRVENDHAWKVSIDEVTKRNYNLDIKNPRTPVDVLESPEELLATYHTKQKEVKEVIEQIRKVITDALSHHDTK
jgi:type I restriction enzyme M protein